MIKQTYNLITSDSLKTFTYEAVSVKDAIQQHVDEHYRVYDADVCGNDEFFVAVKNKDNVIVYCEVNYSWYIEYEPEWELIDNTEIEKVNKEDTKNLHGFRDWMRI